MEALLLFLGFGLLGVAVMRFSADLVLHAAEWIGFGFERDQGPP